MAPRRLVGPLIVKGIQSVEDARAVVDPARTRSSCRTTVAASSTGRPTPLEQLPAIVAAVGDRAEVYLDGGIMSGGDVVAAVATGARACLVGRAYLYGLMAGGERGVQRAADILPRDIIRTMQLLGVTDVAGLTPDRVRIRDRD